MITEYSKINYRGSVSLLACGFVLLFAVNLAAQTSTPVAQPATTIIRVSTGSGTPATVDSAAMEADWPFEWITDFNKAQELAKTRNRSMMLVFSGSDWCGWCQKLDSEIFSKKEFRDYARNNVVSVMLDTPKSMLKARPHGALMQKYGVKGYPGVIILDKDGENVIGRGGYMKGGPQAFIDFLANIIVIPQAKVVRKVLKFDRSPEAILKVLQKQMELSESKKKISAADRFAMDVTMGEWLAVKRYLHSLSITDAKAAYFQLLNELKATRYVKSGSSSKKRLKSVLTLEDLFLISDCCPGKLDDKQIGALAEILKVILGSGDYRAVMLDILEKGTPRFGGSDRDTRLAAAKLLFAVNLKVDGGKYLPDPDLAMKQKDIEIVKMHIICLAEKARVDKDDSAMDQAWELGQWILLDNVSSASERKEAFAMTLSLIPTLEESVAREWLKKRFKDKPLLGMKILATIGDGVVADSNSKDVKKRSQNLALLASTVEPLLATLDDDSWDKTLNALALCWAIEAETSVLNYRKPQRNNRYGYRSSRTTSKSKVVYVPISDLLSSAPDTGWLARLNDDIRVQILTMKARLFMKAEDIEEALDAIKLVAVISPRQCSALFNDYLRVWSVVSNHTPVDMDERTQRMIRLGYYQSAGAIPITRSRQVRNLAKLGVLFKDIKKITTAPVSASTAVTVFAECHSKAEVFLKEDIELVFGKIEEMPSAQRISLIAYMRGRLADSWQKLETQSQAKTNRSESQMYAEVSRGYRIIEELIQASKDDDNWQYHRLKAMAMYDSAEYYYSLKDKDIADDAQSYSLAEYTRQRDAALESFKKSAFAYSKIAPELHSSERSVLVYLHWFYVTLGASDLAHLKRSADYNRDYLADIRKAIESLPDDLKDEHMQAFSDNIQSALGQVGADVKMRLLRASLEITGDHPSSQFAKKILSYYAELLNELKLKVRVDSDHPGAVVGSERPFGLFIELEHTRNIERESGGFSKYIQNANSRGYSRQKGVDHRDIFRKYITDALSGSFQIESLVFSEPSLKSRDIARANWRVTPLAYCVLKVNDKSVDEIPPIQIDLDFADTQGRVVLPLVSDILPIDAKGAAAPSPVSDLVITQVLDEREIAKGKLKLQIDVKANGIIPAFEELFQIDNIGVALDGQIADFDRGLAVDKLDTESERIAPVSQRSWDIDFKIPLDESISFQFPVLKDAFAGAKVANKRYDDADIVEAASSITIKTTKVDYRGYIYGVTGVAVLALIIWLLVRMRKPDAEAVSVHKLPQNITAFTLLSYIKHIESQNAANLSPQELELFRVDIAALEKAYFSPNQSSDQESQPDVDQMARKYQAMSMKLIKTR